MGDDSDLQNNIPSENTQKPPLKTKRITKKTLLLSLIAVLTTLGVILTGILANNYIKSHGNRPSNKVNPTIQLEIGKIDTKLHSIIEETAYIETTTGKFELKKDRSSSKNPDHINLDYYFAKHNEHYYFTKSNDIYQYNPVTKILKNIEIPKNPRQYDNPNHSSIDVETLNENELLITVGDPAYYTYLVNFDTNQITDFYSPNNPEYKSFPNGGSTHFVKLNDSYLLIFQSHGDACFSGGQINLMNLKTLQIEKVTEYNSGCVGNDNYAYLGIFDKKLIMAKREWQDAVDPDEMYGFEIYHNLKLIDPINKKETILISEDKMPKEVTDITMDEENKFIYLNTQTNNETNQPWYKFDIDNNKLTKYTSKFKDVPNDNPVKDSEETKIYTVETKEIQPSTLKETKLSEYALSLVDSNDNAFSLININQWKNLFTENKGNTKKNNNELENFCFSRVSYYFSSAKLENNVIHYSVMEKPFPGRAEDRPKCEGLSKEIDGTINLITGSVTVGFKK